MIGNARFPQIAVELLEANWLTEKEGFEPSFDAKAHSHWPVLQRPTSATGKSALNGRKRALTPLTESGVK